MQFNNKQDLVTWAILAGSGGLAKFLSTRLDPNAPILTRGRFIFMAIANICVSGFSGILGALMMSGVAPDTILVPAAAGVFGFAGIRGLEVMLDKLSNKI